RLVQAAADHSERPDDAGFGTSSTIIRYGATSQVERTSRGSSGSSTSPLRQNARCQRGQKVTAKAGPVDKGPRGAGPVASPIGGDDDAPDWWSIRSGQISRSDLPSSYDRPPPKLESVEVGSSDWHSVDAPRAPRDT
ncbi:MAG: hypothetical protein ACKPKO_01875, partial [Candidatus Fonsibacter sp.]